MGKVEDLAAIVELAKEWCQTYGYDYVSITVVEGNGMAHTDPERRGDYIDVYLPTKNDR